MRILKKVLAIIIIQAIIMLDFAFAMQPKSTFLTNQVQPSDTLSPQININATQFQELLASYLRRESTPFKPGAVRRPTMHETAYNLVNGYEKLDALITTMKKFRKKTLIIAIDGDVSTGKTSIQNIIKKQGISGIRKDKITFLSTDEIVNDFMEQENFSFIEAFAELPFILEKRISLSNDADLIIVQGSDNLSFLEEAGYSPDLVLILEASNMTKLKRHLMRNGFFLGIKFFFEDKFYPYIPQDTLSLTITNETHIPFLEFLSQASFKTLTKSLEYIMFTFIIEIFQKKTVSFENGIKNLLPKKTLDIKGEVDIAGLISLHLKMFSYLINKLYDAYVFFQPSRDIVSIIRARFGNQEVFDVGTGDGTFVEKFQQLLDRKGIKSKVTGIDIKAADIAQGRSLNRNIKWMSVDDAHTHYANTKFDIITVNAPDAPEYAVREAMKVLKPDGLLILRMVRLWHSKEDREEVIAHLKKDYEVEVLEKPLHNLPTGFYHRLQHPVLVTHKGVTLNKSNPDKKKKFNKGLLTSSTDFAKNTRERKKGQLIEFKPKKIIFDNSADLIQPISSITSKFGKNFISQAI